MKNNVQVIKDKIDQLNQLAWEVRINDSPRAQALSHEALGLSKEIEYPKGNAEALRSYGFCLVRLSKNEEALTCLNESFSIFESLSDLTGLSVVYEYLGIIQRNWGNFGASLELLNKGLALSQQTEFLENESTNFYQIGVTYKHLGNYEKALDCLHKCLSVSRSISYSLMEAYAINVIGSIYFDIGDYTNALDYYKQGLVNRQQYGDKWGEAGSLDNIGFTYSKLKSFQEAINYCEQSLVISKSTGDKRGQANTLLHLAEIYNQKDDLFKSNSFCRQSLEIRRLMGDKKGEAEALLFLADLQRASFQPKEKVEMFEMLFNALKISDEIKAADLMSKAHWALYESYKLSKDYMEALGHLELHIKIEKELHKDAINQKVLNFEISRRAEESEKETELFRIKNVELVGLYEEIKNQKEEIENTLTKLKEAQTQLIQSEKMASLGELTAGIAHEIQNPLNFVNNFSEVNSELISEMKNELDAGNIKEAISIANDIDENEQKINHHGKRADVIVKNMLQHSRSSIGQKKLTDINALADEYLRLSYHGMRANNKSFNVNMKTDFDESIGKINIIPQDIGRVLLNLYNNAFYVLAEKNTSTGSVIKDGYEPTISITTKKINDKVEIKVKDNGNGIPQKIWDKIFQPFFTTKPTGQGTGLGLSLSYDIIKAHGGEIKVETKEGEGAEFIIKLPLL